MANDLDLEYSIVICSFNPDKRILKRCLDAVSSLDVRGISHEIILVDNNSSPALNTLSEVKNFLNNTPHSRCVVERIQGLTPARIRGIDESSGSQVVFFDDDNEPYSDYIISLKKLQADHPNVGAWGPGNVWVDFVDGINDCLSKSTEAYAKEIFQEKHEEFLSYGNAREWQGYYPYGTGLSVQYKYLKNYSLKVKEQAFSAVGRKGNSLSSGEDVQIVWFCINESAAAGISPTLKVNHLIPKKRANFNYLKKLTFGPAVGYHVCTSEIIKDHKMKLRGKCLSSNHFSIMTLGKYIKCLVYNDQVRTLQVIHYIAVNCGIYLAFKKPVPKIVIRVLNLLGIPSNSLLL